LRGDHQPHLVTCLREFPLRFDHDWDDRDKIDLAEVARPDILLAAGSLLREVDPSSPRPDMVCRRIAGS